MAEAEAADIGTETPDGAPIGGAEEKSTHYQSLEEADAAARKFQGLYDKSQEQLKGVETLLKLGTPREIENFIQKMLPVAQREDFNDYINNKLRQESGANTSGDELLTDEERELREELRASRQDTDSLRGDLLEFRVERASEKMKEVYGDLFQERSDAVLDSVRRLASQGLVKHTKGIDFEFLDKAFWNSMSHEERMAYAERVARARAERSVNEQQRLGTSVPTQEGGGAPVVEEPKTIGAAIRAGLEDYRRTSR